MVAADSTRAVGNGAAVAPRSAVGRSVADGSVGAMASVGASGAACGPSDGGSCVGAQASSNPASRASTASNKTKR